MYTALPCAQTPDIGNIECLATSSPAPEAAGTPTRDVPRCYSYLTRRKILRPLFSFSGSRPFEQEPRQPAAVAVASAVASATASAALVAAAAVKTAGAVVRMLRSLLARR